MTEIVTLALVTASVIIVIGFLGNYLFKRTGLPDMLYLIALGIVFGPILNVFDHASIMSLAPYLAALSLVIILFDGGLRMNIYQVFSESPKAAMLAILGFVVATITVTLFMHVVMGLPLVNGILFGTIYGGGGSSVAVLSLVTKIKINKNTEVVLSLESVIDDILCVVGSLVVIGIIMTGYADILIISRDIAGQFSIGAVIGVVFGVIWLSILRRVAKEPYAYMLTLAVVLFGYTVSEYLGGSGALSSFLFGLVLGNEKDIFKILKRESSRSLIVDAGLRRLQEEIAFLIRSFFFVYLGLIAVSIDSYSLFWGIIISFLLLIIRYGVVKLATIRSPYFEEHSLMTLMLTRGLVAAILATLPMQYGLLYADLYLNITLVVVISTAIINTVGVQVLSRRRAKNPEKPPQTNKLV
ncbi:MAG: cation:proton antiporter [Candidatus Bathyarchaeia archaeon]